MNPKGMWQAGIWRTIAETNLPLVFSIFLMMIWPPQAVVQFGWYFVIFLATFIWQVIWPAYRLRRKAGTIWVRIRYWLGFMLVLSLSQIILSEVLDWLFFQEMMGNRYPELYETFMEDQEGMSTAFAYLISFFILYLLIAGNRLVFWSWFRFLQWTRRKLVRQFTLSHIMMLILLFWLSAVVWLVYQVTWGMPKNLGGVNQAKEVAAWTAPLFKPGTPEKDLQRWTKQVKEANGPFHFWYFDDLPQERHWRLYDRKGDRVAGEPPQAAEREEKLVRKSLQGRVARSENLDASTHLAVAPVWDNQYRVVGVVVLEKQIEPVLQISSVILIFFLFLAVSFGGVFLFLIVAMLIASFFAYLRARVFTRRFEKVRVASSEWAKGRLNHRMETDWPDELGTMSEQLNQVAASLQEATWKLEKEKEQVEAVLRQKKKFMADVSHELRTPVAILKGYLEVGEERGEWRDQDLFRRELDRLQQMIDELFTQATKDEQENEPFLRESLHPDEVLKEVFDTFQPIAWREKKISVGLSLLERDQGIIADPVRLRQILHNLLRNALRHTPEGGLVHLAAEEDQDRVLLIVADTGSGMSEEEMAHVFRRYYRGRVTSGEYGGAGIGLALVKEWSERMGAEVSVQSEQGKGTRVILSFAVADGKGKD
ncbi:HAMP domain-containing histidine kinase [Kroppenstedtia eburnea]|uniref:histidine kinase n=1 Tax=Kroppenstedtia eburnea TaxID=714067 RepID=A0A1N7KPR9_9BACL|nr:HAMP domain-containing histidine kinase [Kroppenstedtia eburnea]QKI82871.1 HAMP domain-containing histidine kinase [Kroppenstedtia eburnea]SIS63578.1 Signal transduction histidine kinase [Kroppenstedtia eburnea]